MAGGEQSMVAPAKYTNGKRATYVFERRYVDGKPTNTVLIDSRTSEANRLEDALVKAIKEGHPILSAMPKIVVTYSQEGKAELVETDLQLPHRAFDAHIRLGFDAGSPTKSSIVKNPLYKAARDATSENALALFNISPVTLLLGGWDSTRKSRQARFASCVTGEMIGVLSDQEQDPESTVTHRSGARVDPIATSVSFDQTTSNDIRKRLDMDQLKKGKEDKGSSFVIGAIPPSTGDNAALDGISVKRIIRSRVLSFSVLRSLCFGKGAHGDRAIRCMLAALALDAMARADAELNLRANAHLVENAAPQVTLYERFGVRTSLEPVSIEVADVILAEAYDELQKATDIVWNGQNLEVIGESAILEHASNIEEQDS